MHGWMTSRHEGCVSTMLTESDWSIALPVRRFKGRCDETQGCKPTSTAFRVFSVLTMRALVIREEGNALCLANSGRPAAPRMFLCRSIGEGPEEPRSNTAFDPCFKQPRHFADSIQKESASPKFR